MSKKTAVQQPDFKAALHEYSRRLSDHWTGQLRKQKRIPQTGEIAQFRNGIETQLWQEIFKRAEQLDPTAKDWLLHRPGDDPNNYDSFIMNLAREEADRLVAQLLEPARKPTRPLAKFVRAAEAARIVQVDTSTVTRWAASDEIESYEEIVDGKKALLVSLPDAKKRAKSTRAQRKLREYGGELRPKIAPR